MSASKHEVHHVAPGHLVYCNFSGWDIYRSEMPLLALIEPHRMEDMAQSIVLMYKQGGWIGRWPHINRYTNVMAGSPLTVVLCTHWLDGLHGFDIKSAWEGMLQDATQAPPPGNLTWRARNRVDQQAPLCSQRQVQLRLRLAAPGRLHCLRLAL